MTLRARDAFFENLLLQPVYEFAVLGMYCHNCAEIACSRETVHEYFVVGHDGAFVRHEMLKAVDAMIANQCGHVGMYRIVPPRNRNMERVVGDGLLCPFAPLLIRFKDVLLRGRDGEIDDHRCTTGQARGSSRIKILGCHRAHERQLHMRVRIDAAWHDVLATCIDDRGAFRRVEVLAYSCNDAVFAEHIRAL